MKYIEKIEDLVEGEIYYQNSGYSFIFKYRKDNRPIGYGEYLCINSKSFYPNNKTRSNDTNFKTVRHATYQEKQQLLNSIKAGKYVEPPKELQYEIY